MNYTGKINSYFIQKDAKSYLKTLYQVLHVVFGFNFGIFQFKSANANRFVTFVTIMYNLILRIVTLFTLYSCLDFQMYVYVIYYALEHIVYMITLLFQKINLSQFLRDMTNIDKKLSYQKKVDDKVIIGFVIFIIIMKCFVVMFSFGTWPFWFNFVYIYMWTCIDIIPLTMCLVYYSINQRLISLGRSTKLSNADYVSLTHTYKYIVDITEAMKSSFDALLILGLLFIIPENMFYLYALVAYRNTLMEAGLHVFVTSTVSVIIMIIEAVAPAICAGLLASQAKHITTELHNQLIFTKEERKAHEILQFIKYIEARSMEFQVYKVIPLNANLLGIVLNFCITYLIVILQFSHVY